LAFILCCHNQTLFTSAALLVQRVGEYNSGLEVVNINPDMMSMFFERYRSGGFSRRMLSAEAASPVGLSWWGRW
jgi:hypothetical protein